MNKEIQKAIADAWSRDFSHEAAIEYAKKATGQTPTLDQVIDAYTEQDLQFNQWCKKS